MLVLPAVCPTQEIDRSQFSPDALHVAGIIGVDGQEFVSRETTIAGDALLSVPLPDATSQDAVLSSAGCRRH
jgi:hypothetical protein